MNSMENTSQQLPPASSPTFPEMFVITSLPVLMADLCLEATCQAFTVLGKPSAIKRPCSRVMPPFIGGVPVAE